MENFIRFILLGVLVVFSFVRIAEAADRMYIVPIAEADYASIDDYVDSNQEDMGNTPCQGDNYSGYSGHEGMDYVLSVGTPVYAAANGTVLYDQQICGEGSNCYGYFMSINHGNNNWTLYAHLSERLVPDGVSVNQGDLIAYSGDSGPSYPHLHWEVLTDVPGNVPEFGQPNNPYYCNDEWFISSPPIYADQYVAVDGKADELWGLGLIHDEVQNMHWYAGASDSIIVETWVGGSWGDEGEVALTFDAWEEQSCHEAFVLRHGFWAEYQLYGPDQFGAPLGDELDSTDTSGYQAYDPYCTGEQGYTEPEACIELFCGPSRDYTSVQRFENVTLCWNEETQMVECDPTWDNAACYMSVGTAAMNTPTPGDLYDVDGTVYWYTGLNLRGIVSSDVFNACGFNWGEIQTISQADLDPLGWGEVVDDPVDCGAMKEGDLFSMDGTTTIYQYASGLKRPITSGDVFTSCGFDWQVIKTFPASSVLSIPDGSVINSASSCFLTPDLVWRQYAGGDLAAWYMDGTDISSGASLGSSSLDWYLVGSGDFNRDGSVDLLWRHNSTPYEVSLWELSGTTVVNSILISSSSDPSWVIRGVSDFTSDGEPDMLWKDQYTGELSLWVVSQEEVVTSVQISATSDTSWDIRTTGDLTGDGKADILWRNPTTGALSLWEMDDTSYVSSIPVATSSLTTWDVEAIGDFTADGQNDILWRNPTTGEMARTPFFRHSFSFHPVINWLD